MPQDRDVQAQIRRIIQAGQRLAQLQKCVSAARTLDRAGLVPPQFGDDLAITIESHQADVVKELRLGINRM